MTVLKILKIHSYVSQIKFTFSMKKGKSKILQFKKINSKMKMNLTKSKLTKFCNKTVKFKMNSIYIQV